MLVDTQGDPASATTSGSSLGFAERLGTVEGVDAVESPFSAIPNPQTGQPLTADELAALYAMPREQWPPQLLALYDRFVSGSTVRFDALSPLQPSSPEGTAVIPRIRALDGADGLSVKVGGSAALGHDFLVAQAARAPTPWASRCSAMRRDPVPAVRLGRAVRQGGPHDPAVDQPPASARWC